MRWRCVPVVCVARDSGGYSFCAMHSRKTGLLTLAGGRRSTRAIHVVGPAAAIGRMRMWMLAAATVLGALSALRIVDCFQLRNPAETTSHTMENYQIVFPVKVSPSSRFRRSSSARNSQGVSYVFSAFNRTFILDLEPLSGFFSPSFHVMTFSDDGGNSSSLNVHRGHHLRDCFYKGTVRHDYTSLVTLSSCKGLLGLIHTCHGDYKIERHHPLSSSAHRLVHVEKHLNACQNNTDKQKYPKKMNGFHYDVKASRAKRSVSKEWNLEVLVVADSKMKRYHGENLEMYILTLMSSVSLIYKNPSIGNDINISVVKLIVMKEGQDTGIIFPSAAKTLRNFCRWQQQLNDPSPNGVNHDTAILLTRENLCRQSKTCDTLGLAQSGMVCDHHSSCAVIEDNGLSAVFTIAHELGHILGIPHDDDKKCARFQEQGQRLHVMARMLDYNSHPWSWSDCSRHYVTTFLDAGHGYCLLNKSRENKLSTFEHGSTPAGELYDMDYQCQLVFGQGSKICPYMPVCKRLWCTMEDVTRGGCRTQHMPWADGTKCGLDKSCLHGECVPEPAVPSPQDGQWGQWQSFGPCSRSCGGGIKSSKRKCDSPTPINGGRYCVGDRVRYKSCNTEDCPFGSQEFREEQCSAFDGKTFSFSGIEPEVQWEPHYEGIPAKDVCKLYCRARGTSAYFLLKEKVIDGTTCGPDVYDVCINGICTPAGCDHKLGSNKVSDGCGVCGGDNSTCRVIQGEFANVQYGYNNVVVVPAGASKIEILQFGHQNQRDENYLALMDSNNSYILNGNHMVSMYPLTLNYGGAVLQYSGSRSVIERINCTKQIQKDLYVQVLTVGSLEPPSVTYNYTISLENQVFYHWHLEENWSECNSVCQGEQYRKAICVNKRDGKTVSDGHCPDQERPQHLARVCNTHCFLSWNVSELSSCSASCGVGNISVDVKCTQHVESNGIHEISDKFCAHMEPRPSHLKTCFGQCNSTSWKYGEWSQCSKSCGGGFQQRKAVCVGDGHVELPESLCDDNMKVTEQKCAELTCPEWKTGPWKECSATCGSGERSRMLWCEQAGEKLANEYCNSSSIPSHVGECDLPPCTKWRGGGWGPCSVTCGKGTAKRSVLCFSLDDVEVSQSLCVSSTKPEDTQPCEQHPCRILPDVFPLTPSRIFENTVPALPVSAKDGIVMWKSGPWSRCSVTCGDGIRNRSVTCHNSINNEILPEKKCRKLERPSSSEVCHFPSCGQWTSGEWGECSVTCGEGIQMRLVVCLLNDGHKGQDTSCDLSYRPPQEQICRKSHCSDVLSQPLPDMDVIFNSVEGEYYWRTGSWGKCSRSCGGGVRRRQVACYDEGGHLSTYCDLKQKPSESTPCNAEKCPEWTVGEWTECSTTCGVGFQSRQILCTSNKGNRLPNERCPISAPETMKRCKIKNCFHWSWSPWSECSSSCGQGIQTRFSRCIHGKRHVEDNKCDISSKPQSESRPCQGINCTYQWKKKKWSKCSASCGIGHKEREVMCVNGNNETVNDYFCRRKKKPRVKRRCHQYRCPFVWQVNHWSECSQTCGKGLQARDVTCHRVNAYKWVDPNPLPETSRENESLWCKEEEKPSTTKGCNLGSCHGFVWRTGPWLQCSVGCGAGRQRRKVRCYSADGKQMKKNKCDKHLRPQKRRRCYMRPCPPVSCMDYKQKKNVSEDGEQEIFVRGRFVQVYCSDMNTTSPKEYITLVRGESENYSEIYNKRLLSPETCPYRGIRYHSCDCVSDDSARFGLTRFHRVAVNISSLQILTSDFTFSQTQVGQPVPFGESGDCYSMNKCPQGRFSVNLQETGFIVSPETKWVSQGQHASHKIRHFEDGQVIQGKCGGYCGMCAPDSQLGLLLDVAPP